MLSAAKVSDDMAAQIQRIDVAAQLLAKSEYVSSQAECVTRRTAGLRQMLHDLHRMSNEDGCIAAAWALVFILRHAEEACRPSPDFLKGCAERIVRDDEYFTKGDAGSVNLPYRDAAWELAQAVLTDNPPETFDGAE